MTTMDTLGVVPTMRTDFERRHIGADCVVWSPLVPEPVALDPIAAVMLDVVDGIASIGDLALDVHEEIGLSLQQAQEQVTRVVEWFARAGLLTSSPSSTTADEAITQRAVFIGPVTPCSENESRLGTETLLLRFGSHTIRIACDSRRGARKLRAALAEHLIDGMDGAPLAFVLTAPQGLQRKHRLVDRSGFVLSEASGLDAGLHALAAHLTAFLPAAPDTVRIRARGIVAGDRTIVCLTPLLYSPAIEERDLERAGLRMIDRLAVDVDLGTGLITNPEIPWPSLRDLEPARNHVGTGGTRPATAIVNETPIESVAPTAAQMVAQIAAEGLCGSRGRLLDAATLLVRHAELRSASAEGSAVLALLGELAG